MQVQACIYSASMPEVPSVSRALLVCSLSGLKQLAHNLYECHNDVDAKEHHITH